MQFIERISREHALLSYVFAMESSTRYLSLFRVHSSPSKTRLYREHSDVSRVD